MRELITQEQAELLLSFEGKDLLFGETGFASVKNVEFDIKNKGKSNQRIYLTDIKVTAPLIDEEVLGSYKEKFVLSDIISGTNSAYNLHKARKRYLKLKKAEEIFRGINKI